MKNADLKKRILDISYKLNLSHIGSCLTAVDIIDEIYKTKEPDEKFVLSAGHAHLAHLVVMEKYLPKIMPDEEMPEEMIKRFGIHCERKAGCDVSTGSLGHGIGIAVGMALADRTKNVYCLLSDGECAEGSVFEAISVYVRYKLWNLKIYINKNGYGAYREIDRLLLPLGSQFEIRYTNMDAWPDYLQGQQAHYVVLTKQQYEEAIRRLS